jgi:hypothetical protein
MGRDNLLGNGDTVKPSRFQREHQDVTDCEAFHLPREDVRAGSGE